MPCDRCGGAMDTYELDGRDARSCRECGYVDVPVRHEPEGGGRESWEDAIDRFQEQYADVRVSAVDLPPESSTDDPADERPDTESVEPVPTEESTDEQSSGEASGEKTGEASGEESKTESPEEASATDD